MTNKKNIKINNLSDIISNITNLMHPQGTYWYRGHSDKKYELLPSLFRPINKIRNAFYDEATLIEEMVRRFPNIRSEHNSTLELLTYAQHYGLPTRLLDWSENLLVALYFCCKDKLKTDGALYILQTDEIHKYKNNALNNIEDLVTASFEIEIYKILIATCNNFHKYFITSIPPKLGTEPYTELVENTDVELLLHFSLEKDEPLEIDLGIDHVKIVDMYTYCAPLLNSRLIAQKGCFTVHGGKIINNKEIVKIPDMNDLIRTGSLKKIIIPKTAKNNILRDLNICGINEHTLFPEIEHQVESIKSYAIK